LKNLIVCGCQIKTISQESKSLENLKFFDIFENESIELPLEFGKFPKTICADYNDFDECIKSIQWVEAGDSSEIDIYELTEKYFSTINW
jgi:hypothetical protein